MSGDGHGSMIEIRGLTQSYRRKQVLQDVNLRVWPGEICALVGRNGAGKSTLIRSMLGLLPVSQGEIRIAGHSHKGEAWKRQVAYLPEKFQLYPQLTGAENLQFFLSLEDGGGGSGDGLDAQSNASARVSDALRQVNLLEHKDEPIKGYSKGMLQRLGLAIMLAYDAKLLVLDEPTSGLDPMGRQEILRLLEELKGSKTILFSSHHLDEIRQICTHVAFLEDGVIRKYGVEEFCEKQALGG